jgi:hypothetical protein
MHKFLSTSFSVFSKTCYQFLKLLLWGRSDTFQNNTFSCFYVLIIHHSSYQQHSHVAMVSSTVTNTTMWGCILNNFTFKLPTSETVRLFHKILIIQHRPLCPPYKVLKKLYLDNVWSEVLTAVVMKSTIFWNIMPYSPFQVKLDWLSMNYMVLYPRRQYSSYLIILSYEDFVFCDVMLCKKLPAFRRNPVPPFWWSLYLPLWIPQIPIIARNMLHPSSR